MRNSQEIANLIKETAKSQKKTVGKMLTECGLSVNTLSSMQSGGYYPRLEAITKIADYLSVSVDYLLGRAEHQVPPTPELDPTTKVLVEHFNKLSPQDKIDILNLVLKKAS